MRLAFWCIVAGLAAVLASFAASNREFVSLALWPLPVVAELPLYLAIIAALCVGFIVGALSAWVGGARRRRQRRRHARRIAALERELAATQAQLPAISDAPRPPALAPPG